MHEPMQLSMLAYCMFAPVQFAVMSVQYFVQSAPAEPPPAPPVPVELEVEVVVVVVEEEPPAPLPSSSPHPVDVMRKEVEASKAPRTRSPCLVMGATLYPSVVNV